MSEIEICFNVISMMSDTINRYFLSIKSVSSKELHFKMINHKISFEKTHSEKPNSDTDKVKADLYFFVHNVITLK